MSQAILASHIALLDACSRCVVIGRNHLGWGPKRNGGKAAWAFLCVRQRDVIKSHSVCFTAFSMVVMIITLVPFQFPWLDVTQRLKRPLDSSSKCKSYNQFLILIYSSNALLQAMACSCSIICSIQATVVSGLIVQIRRLVRPLTCVV